MNLNFEDLFPEQAASLKAAMSNMPKGEPGLPIPSNQLPYFRPHYNEAELIEGIDYPVGANIDPEFNSRLKPYTKNNLQDLTSEPDTSLALEGRLSEKEGSEKRRPSFDGGQFSQIVLGAIGAVNQLLPNRAKKYQPVVPGQTYNPFAQGTGSQAIMEHGGIISTDEDNFYPYQTGGDPIRGQMPLSSDRSRQKSYTAEMLSYLAGQGANPVGTKGGSFLLNDATMAFDENTARGLYNSMIEFSNRDDVKTMQRDQRISTYYDMMKKHPMLGKTISELANIGYGPNAHLQSSPDDVLANAKSDYLQPLKKAAKVVKNKAGGKVK
jgi:hypothetical protein